MDALPSNFFVERFLLPVLNGLILNRCTHLFRNCLNHYILVHQFLFRLRQLHTDRHSASNINLRPNNFFHRKFGCDRRGTWIPVSYTHLRAHETRHDLVCRLLLEKKKNNKQNKQNTQNNLTNNKKKKKNKTKKKQK